MKATLHYGGFATPLPCNGSMGGHTTKNKKEVTCKRCRGIVRKKEKEGYKAISGGFKK